MDKTRPTGATEPDAPPRPNADDRIPGSPEERLDLRALADRYVADRRLVPPVPMDDLRSHARHLVVRGGLPVAYTDFLTVLISNALWRDTVAGVPFDRRLILLPQCLRDRDACPATMDALGVLCEQCGRCPIGGLQAEAEALGYVVLVAEGTSVVTRLIESGKVDAVIGVSCLSVLERAFPHLAAEAAPGLAIPLLMDGCLRTCLDEAWVYEALRLRSDDAWLGRGDLDRLRDIVAEWFRAEALDERMGPADCEAARLGRDWLLRGGKRWRPFLLASVWRALRAPDPDLPLAVRDLALAVECFHKASLIHDDIEDGDALRYGRATMHTEVGVPVAINVGDALLGDGYRLISRCGLSPDATRAILEVAADGHRTLCAGQGEELAWMRAPRPLAASNVIDIFRRKTAPAFEVALRLGAIAAAGRDAAVEAALSRFSEALGVAYQIRDDLDDLHDGAVAPPDAPRMSILPALAHDRAAGPARSLVEQAWLNPRAAPDSAFDLHGFIRSSGVDAKALQMMEHHKNAAIRSLEPLRNVHLKSLLRRLVSRLVPSPTSRRERGR